MLKKKKKDFLQLHTDKGILAVMSSKCIGYYINIKIKIQE